MSSFKHKLAAKLKRWAERLEHPDAREARRLGVGLPLFRCVNRVRALREIGAVLDIGANKGEWAAKMADCLPDAQIHCFEPLPACKEALMRLSRERRRIHVHPVALGAEDGWVTMNANKFTPSSSMLQMTDRHADLWPDTAHAQPIKVPVRRLDAEADGLGGDIFMKIDVQGYEMAVLQGASETLSRTNLIVAEVLFDSLYENQTKIADLIAFLDDHGFQIAEVLYQHRADSKCFMAYADVAFVSRSLL